MARKPAAARSAKTAGKPQTAALAEKPKDEAQPGSADGASTSAPEAPATKPQADPPAEKPKDDTPPDSTDAASPTAPEALVKPDEVKGVFVRATVERRYRAGFCFDKDGQGFADGVLSDAQLQALEADPLLKVERCTFAGTPEGE
ncbi:HI1506-related protein [Pseudomonas aeruginosa]|uniref:HI1506-related protein n=1 Tax=Pseudomonas aeruginosa TaxID=287 RepID=UPI000FC42BEE|nr:HI1506-related protein [Pseudomonas aeruginosa]RUI34548.1 hypothetical protein IPC443_03460 [Pseudomonas aeruginosa]